MTALEYFRLFAPGFASVDDTTVNQWLAIAEVFVPTGCLDDERFKMAQAYYSAHLMTISASSSGGAIGPITSEKEGDLSRSYGSTMGDNTVLGSTPFGLQFLDITKVCYGGAIMTRYGISGAVR